MGDLENIGRLPLELGRLLNQPAIGTPPGGAANDFRRFFLDPADPESEITAGRTATIVAGVATDATPWLLTNVPDLTAVSVANVDLDSSNLVTLTVNNLPAALSDIEVLVDVPQQQLRHGIPQKGRHGRWGYKTYTFTPTVLGGATIDFQLNLTKRHLDSLGAGDYAPKAGDVFIRVVNKKNLLSSQWVTITIG